MLHEPVHDRVIAWDLGLGAVFQGELVRSEEILHHLNAALCCTVALRFSWAGGLRDRGGRPRRR